MSDCRFLSQPPSATAATPMPRPPKHGMTAIEDSSAVEQLLYTNYTVKEGGRRQSKTGFITVVPSRKDAPAQEKSKSVLEEPSDIDVPNASAVESSSDPPVRIIFIVL